MSLISPVLDPESGVMKYEALEGPCAERLSFQEGMEIGIEWTNENSFLISVPGVRATVNGFIKEDEAGSFMHLDSMYVKELAENKVVQRKKGLGSLLYLAAVRLCQDLGINRIYTETVSLQALKMKRKLFGTLNNHYWEEGNTALDDAAFVKYLEPISDDAEIAVWHTISEIDTGVFDEAKKMCRDKDLLIGVVNPIRIRISLVSDILLSDIGGQKLYDKIRTASGKYAVEIAENLSPSLGASAKNIVLEAAN